MKASLQPLTGVIRVHPEEDGSYKNYSSYTFAATVLLDGSEAVILGIVKAPTFLEVRALFREFSKYGIETVTWERAKNGRTKRVKVRIRS